MITLKTDGPVPTISSLQIAEITGKKHKNVIRDIRVMIVSLYGETKSDSIVPENRRNRHKEFINENAGDLFNMVSGHFADGSDLSHPKPFNDSRGFGWRRDTRGYICEFFLDKIHSLTLAAGYDVKIRKGIIDRWQELEAKQSSFDPAAFLSDPAAMRGLLLTYTEKVISLEAMVSEQKPKVDALNLISTADGSLCITDAAKALQSRPKDLFRYLSENGWIYRRAGCKTWLGYSIKESQGLLEHKVTTYTVDGVERIMEQVRITPKGLAKLAEIKMEGRAA